MKYFVFLLVMHRLFLFWIKFFFYFNPIFGKKKGEE